MIRFLNIIQLAAKLPFIYHILNFFIQYFAKIFFAHGAFVAFALFLTETSEFSTSFSPTISM